MKVVKWIGSTDSVMKCIIIYGTKVPQVNGSSVHLLGLRHKFVERPKPFQIYVFYKSLLPGKGNNLVQCLSIECFGILL